ncbi:hypothetical protein J8273_0842 [Carpediemonas membranifera]|uniref:Uncharacterized protein n=1 Tax=Carpediemonas membranifera TaxID=201153 RepID=A0A8J6E4M2_9EUKA|nr:hypothetical protein J8273_0842 [Carpediemonas membranifera]|eukprot:KAG9397358.1 hypothetical protein J8273_0842 [Carpediemonas membranifera]
MNNWIPPSLSDFSRESVRAFKRALTFAQKHAPTTTVITAYECLTEDQVSHVRFVRNVDVEALNDAELLAEITALSFPRTLEKTIQEIRALTQDRTKSTIEALSRLMAETKELRSHAHALLNAELGAKPEPEPAEVDEDEAALSKVITQKPDSTPSEQDTPRKASPTRGLDKIIAKAFIAALRPVSLANRIQQKWDLSCARDIDSLFVHTRELILHAIDAREVLGSVIQDISITSSSTSSITSSSTGPKHSQNANTRSRRERRLPPPYACSCGGMHWKADCPHRGSTPGQPQATKGHPAAARDARPAPQPQRQPQAANKPAQPQPAPAAQKQQQQSSQQPQPYCKNG